MTKLEVQQRVSKDGKPLDLNRFSWDEETKTFSSTEEGLVLDFSDVDGCTFNAGYSCTFNTGYYCTFNTRGSCTFKTGYYCTFNTGSGCTFKTGHGCTFNAGYSCTFNTGGSCTFNTGGSCTFNTGKQGVVVRRDIFEVIQLVEGQQIRLNGFEIPGYSVIEPAKVETIQIGDQKYNKAEVEAALKNVRSL